MIGSTSTTRDSQAAAVAMVCATLFIANQVAGKATRDAIFLSHFHVSNLPKIVMLAAVLSALAVLGISRLLSVSGPVRVVSSAMCLSAVLFVGEWWLYGYSPGITGVLLYLHMATFGAVLISGFWSVINERFDPHSARQRVAWIAAAAALGGMAGGILTAQVAELLNLRAMLLVLAGLHGLAAIGILGIGAPKASGGTEEKVTTRTGLRTIFNSRYLRSIASLMALVSLAAALLDYAIKAEASEFFTSSERLAAFFGAFYSITGIITFGLQTGFGARVLERFGLTGALVALPGAVLMGGVFATAVTHLWTVVALRGAESVMANSFFRSGFELLYTPLPPTSKRPTKAVIDVGANRVGDIAGAGALMLLFLFVQEPPVSMVISMAMAAAGFALLLVGRLYHGYVDQLAASLRTGVLALPRAESIDATTRHALEEGHAISDRGMLLARIAELEERGDESDEDHDPDKPGKAGPLDDLFATVAALVSGDPERARRALRGASSDARLVPYVLPLLADAALADDARMELRWQVTRISGQLSDALIDPDIPIVAREKIPEIIEVWHSPRALEALTQGLDAGEFAIRKASALAMARMLGRSSSLRVSRRVIYRVVIRELSLNDGHWTSGSARGMSDRLRYVFTVLALGTEQAPMTHCIEALEGEDPIRRGTALEYLENVLPSGVRELLWPRLGIKYLRAKSRRARRQIVEELVGRGTARSG